MKEHTEQNADTAAEIEKLRKINSVLIDRVERSMDQQGHGFSLFQTAINLESQIDRRTSELTSTLAHLNRTNHELETAKNLAEKANLNKSHVLAAASHDVLQPLNAAQLLISSLTSIQNNKEGQRLCQQIERSLDTMTTLLNSLLYMSRLDAGAVQPDWQSVSLQALFDSIESDFQPLAQDKNIELRVKHNNLYVHSDATMLRRIVQNMIANAIEYTTEGGVLVCANSIADRVQIRVADTGCGIENDSLETIFEEFYRGPSSTQQSHQHSAGLGLAIVARMVETLNHSIRVNSIPGTGSCFSLALLAAERTVHLDTNLPTRTNLETVSGSVELAQKRVLFVENDLAVLDAMDGLLCMWGCDHRLAKSPQEAIDAISNSDWQPDWIIADQQLDADETGTATIERVRQRVGASIPAVIVTANPSKELALEAASAGIELMLKPIKPGQLRALMWHQLAHHEATET